jgi:hypothetical protein
MKQKKRKQYEINGERRLNLNNRQEDVSKEEH